MSSTTASHTSRRWLTVIAAGVAAAWFALATPAHAAEFLYWPNGAFGESIARAGVDGTGLNLAFMPTTGATKVAVDTNYIFWPTERGQAGSIARANLDGSAVNVNFIPGVDKPDAVAVDGQHVYFVSLIHGSGRAIGRANVDGTGVVQNLIGNTPANGLAVDGRHIYWTTDSGAIGRADIDGGNPDGNFIQGGAQTRGIAVDDSFIYWTNKNGVGRANRNGTDVDVNFIPVTGLTVGVAVNAANVFWAGYGARTFAGSIGRANLDGTGVNPSFITGVTRPLGLAVSFQPRPLDFPIARANPSKLDFGTQPVGTLSSPSSVVVRNTGTAPLRVSGVRVSSGQVDDFLVSSDACTNTTVPVNGVCLVNVRFGPSASGPRSATLSVASNDPASPLQIPLSGVGGGKQAVRGP